MGRAPIEIMIDQACGCDGTGPVVQKQEMPPTMPDVLLLLADAAAKWWEGKRPTSYSRKKHLENPDINCVTQGEKNLAEAVAKWVKIGV